MAYDKIIDSTKLDADITIIADAIREKSGTSGKMTFPSGMADAVRNIQTGVELPELNELAEPEEVFLGKDYIDSDGQKKTGKFTIDDELVEQDLLISQIAIALKNKAANSGSITLPELGDIAAQSTDIAAGKVLYNDQGDPITGELEKITSYIINNPTYLEETNTVMMNVKAGEDGILRQGDSISFGIPASRFGKASPGDVAKGVTFTSEAGLLVPGEMEIPTSGGLSAKRGNTSSSIIDTGLSSVDYFVLMADSFSVAGLMQLLYRKPNNTISYIVCTYYSAYTKTVNLQHANLSSSTLFTIDGGKVSWNGTGTSALMNGASYVWLAIGTE